MNSATLFDQTSSKGKLILKNRFIASSAHYGSSEGKVDAKLLKIYRDIAQGGVATILSGFTLVSPAQTSLCLLALYDDSFAEGHKQLVDSVHKFGVNILSQITYVGPFANQKLLTPVDTDHKEATVSDLKAIQQAFADTALRGKNIGYDGVQIHHSLYSSFCNRTDAYGGSVANKARMVCETYAAIRAAVGPDYPVWIKLNAVAEGTTLDGILYVAEQLAGAGIDGIEVFGYLNGFSERSLKAEAAAVAEAVAGKDVPVILSGLNRDYAEMTEVLHTTKIRYFGIARPLVQNPNFVNEMKARVEMERENKKQ